MSTKISNLPEVISANVLETDLIPLVANNVTSKVKVSELRNKLGFTPPAEARTVTSASTYEFNNRRFNVRDYGALGDGVANDAVAFNLAIQKARLVGGMVVVPAGKYILNAPLDLTFSNTDDALLKRAIRFVGESQTSFGAPSLAVLVANHTGHMFDMSGSYHMSFENLTIGTGASTPKTIFFFARNSAGSNGGNHRLKNVKFYGAATNAVVYSYAAEENIYEDCFFINTASSPVVFKWTSANIDSLTSSFITIATGSQSNIISHIVRGSFQAKGASGKIFYLDRHDFLSIKDVWALVGDEVTGPTNGHSVIYVDQTNGTSNYGTLENFTGENAAALPTYSIFFTNHTQTPVYWTFKRCRLRSATDSFNVGANVRALLWHIEDVLDDADSNHKAIFSGTLDTSYIKAQGLKFTVATSTSNMIIGDPSYWTITNVRNGGVFLDSTTGGHSFAGVQVPSSDPNTLDDYEEGDWTPILGGATSESGQTYSNQVGSYVKVGKKVTCTFLVSLSTPGTITGDSVIKGLPFTAGNGNKYRAGVAFGRTTGLGIAVVAVAGYVESNTTRILLSHRTAASVDDIVSSNLLIQSGAAPFFIGSFSYIAAN